MSNLKQSLSQVQRILYRGVKNRTPRGIQFEVNHECHFETPESLRSKLPAKGSRKPNLDEQERW